MSSNPNELPVENNEAAQQYEIKLGDDVALAAYQLRGDRIFFTHTEVPQALEGRGIGSRLAKAALDDAKARDLTVIPLCPFINSYIKRHSEYQSIVDPEYR